MRNKAAWLSLVGLLWLSCCSPSSQWDNDERVMRLNRDAYALRYKDIKKCEQLANKALSISDSMSVEALLNLSFVCFQRMDFEGVGRFLDRVRNQSRNQVYLLCADVMEMKVTQRTNQNAAFYRAKLRAEHRLNRILEEHADLNSQELYLFIYAQSEFHITSSTYYYYQGQDSLSVAQIREMEDMNLQRSDTAQWLYWAYMMGSGGMIDASSQEIVAREERKYMLKAYNLAKEAGYVYFEANAIQSLAEKYGQISMAKQAIALFKDYGDIYQTACAYRTLGELQFENGDYESSLQSYAEALRLVNLHHRRFYHDKDSLRLYSPDLEAVSTEVRWMKEKQVLTVPSWIAAIRLQISKSYSALGMKSESDYNRNAYIDILQHTNQNEELEQRTEELKHSNRRIQTEGIVALSLFLLLLLFLYLNRRRVSSRLLELQSELTDLKEGRKVPADVEVIREQQEELEERLAVSQMNLTKNKVQNIENRARVSMVHAVVPYLDRIVGEALRMQRDGKVGEERREYILQLIAKITDYNNLLTDWIRVQQGQLALRMRTVEIQPLFDIVAESRYVFLQKGLELEIMPTPERVKADEALTLFMINTLADNSRKFTPRGGTIRIQATQVDENLIEISVSDTGVGLSDTDLELLNHTQVYDPNEIGKGAQLQKGFGFGLANCRGIIEKYKKHSALFARCQFGVRNNDGSGCTFFFRLPRVVGIFLLMLMPLVLEAKKQNEATALYDSVYECNLQGRYAEAMAFGKQALQTAGTSTDVELIMGIHNEMAISALALNNWQLYEYHNHRFTQLRKQLNQDASLPSYVERLATNHRNGRMLLVLSIVFLLLLLGTLYRLLINRKVVAGRDLRLQINACRERLLTEAQQQADALADQIQRSSFVENRIYVQNQVLSNCLSTIKHESMYYPARIQNLVSVMQDTDIATLNELVNYYRKSYTILCSQADAVVAEPGFKRQNLTIWQLAEIIAQGVRPATLQCLQPTESSVVCADPILIQLFSTQLANVYGKQAAGFSLQFQVDGRFANFRLCILGVQESVDRLAQLFTPDSGSFPLFVARQIIREHDICLGNPGLRLNAENSPEGLVIHFSLLNTNIQKI